MRALTPLALAALLLLVLPASAQTTYTWTGLGRLNGQPDNQNWANGGNWAPVGVPGPTDTAVLNAYDSPQGGVYQDINLAGATYRVASLVLSGSRTDARSFTLSGSGTVLVSGTLSFSQGALFGATLVCEATCTGAFSGTQFKDIAPGTFVNHGTTTWSGSASIRTNAGTITNDGTLTVADDGLFVAEFAGGTLLNTGLLVKTGTGTTYLGSTLTFHNDGGTVRVAGGTLVVSGSAGGAINAGFTGASRIEGPGLVRLVANADAGSGTLWSGTVTVAGPVEIADGSSIKGQFALAACDGCLRFTGGEVAFDTTPGGSVVTVPAGSFLDIEPTTNVGLRGTTLVNRGTVRWHGPTPLRMLTATIANEGTLDLIGSGQALANVLGGTIVNRGLIVRRGPGTTFLAGSIVLRNEGGTVRVTDGTLSLASPADEPVTTTLLDGSRVEGAGLLRFRDGTNWAGTTTVAGRAEMAGGSYSGDFTLAACDGCLRWTAGEVAFNAQGTSFLRIPAGGFLDLDGPADHNLRGAVLVNRGTTRWHAGQFLGVVGSGTLTNEGRFEAAPGGVTNVAIVQSVPGAVFALAGTGRDTLRVDRDPVLTGGTLEVTVGPAVSDVMSVSGTATLGGIALRVRVGPGYTPVLGDSRVVLTSRFAVVGAFADTRTVNAVNGVGFASAVEGTVVRVTATPGAVAGEAGPGAGEVPAGLSIAAPVPNPFRGAARLRLGVPAAGPVEVAAYDLLGRRVAVLADAPMEAGWHELAWDTDGLAAGVYVLRIQAGAETRTVRALHVR